jgi:hypothetical protein
MWFWLKVTEVQEGTEFSTEGSEGTEDDTEAL